MKTENCMEPSFKKCPGHQREVVSQTSRSVIKDKQFLCQKCSNTENISYGIENVKTFPQHIYNYCKPKKQKLILSGNEYISQLIFLDIVKIATCSFINALVKIWNIPKEKCCKRLPKLYGRVVTIILLESGYIASGTDSSTVVIWNFYIGRCLKVLEGHKGPVSALVELPNKTILSGSLDKTIKFWDSSTYECTAAISGNSPCYAAILLNCDFIGVSSQHSANIYNLNNLSIIHSELKGHQGPIVKLEHTTNSLWIVSGSIDKTIKLWDWQKASCVRTFLGHAGGITTISMVASNIFVSSAKDGKVMLRNLECEDCNYTITGSLNIFGVFVRKEDLTFFCLDYNRKLEIWSME